MTHHSPWGDHLAEQITMCGLRQHAATTALTSLSTRWPAHGPTRGQVGAARARPEHVAGLARLGELALECLPLVLYVGVVPLHLRAVPRAEGQQEAVQVAAVAHQLRVVRWPAAQCINRFMDFALCTTTHSCLVHRKAASACPSSCNTLGCGRLAGCCKSYSSQ